MTQCILWTRRVDADGYGRVGHRGLAHREAWEKANGRSVPPGLYVLHTCDIRNCVNPAHLYVGTQYDNMRDMVQRGRRAPTDGERHPGVKLSDADVIAIRSLKRSNAVSNGELARAFGITRTHVARLLARQQRAAA